jgi:hypothetical protein
VSAEKLKNRELNDEQIMLKGGGKVPPPFSNEEKDRGENNGFVYPY